MDPQVLLYLPGLDGTGRLLHRQPVLHERYQVHCECYPQDPVGSYEEMADAAAAHLAEMGGGRPGVVLAESFGGAVALMLALRHPALVERLLLVNTFAYFPSRWFIRLAAWGSRFLPAKPSHPATRWVRGLFFFSPDIPPRERAAWWERTRGVTMRVMGERAKLIAGLDLRPHLSHIQVPALVVVAPDDRVVPPRAGKELACLLPRARLLQRSVGHAALIHPRLDIAQMLTESRYWPSA
jgi:pimeloyl-ACP methyl ester carboxylesterase